MQVQPDHEFFIQWHLTERCNLRCAHCYQESSNHLELSTAEALALISETAETMAAWAEQYHISLLPSFNITGGEPFLRQDLFALLQTITNQRFKTHLLTNGTLIDEALAGRLQECGVAGVQVSLEGPEPVHDAIRGPGSFRRAVAGIRHLLETGLRVTVNMTLSRLNADCVEEMLGLAADLGVQRLGFSRLIPSGRGKALLPQTLDKHQVRRLYEKAFSLQTNGVELVSGDPTASRDLAAITDDRGEVPFGGCAAGVSGLTVLPDGTVLPCRRLPLPLGNIRRDSIREIWANSEILERLRTRECYQGACRSCPRWAVCRGCRAVAYAYTGDFLAGDPHCRYS